MDEQKVLELIRREFNGNYSSGSPRIPPHTHNGIDNLKISASNLLGLNTGGIGGMQVFTSSGTFTVPSGVPRCWVRGVGGGAAGGTVFNNTSTGNAGGAGAYCESVIDLTGVGSVSVTIGAGGVHVSGSISDGGDGGNTTFGSYFTAGGGKGNGAGGTATGADVNINGGGQSDVLILYGAGSTTSAIFRSSDSSPSMFGYGVHGSQGPIGSGANGISASGYGDGGSGGAIGTAGGGSYYIGGDGFQGLLIVIW